MRSLPSSADGSAACTAARSGRRVLDQVVRWHDQQGIVLAARKRPICGGRDRRRRVPGNRFEQNGIRDAARAFELVDDEEPLFLSGRDERRMEQVSETSPDRRLQKQFVTEELLKLLGVTRSGERPQTRAAAARENDRSDHK